MSLNTELDDFVFINNMTQADWQQVKSLFHEALEREPLHRRAFLDEACSGNAGLRREVEALIESHEREGEFIDDPAYELAAGLIVKPQASIATGKTLGTYRILSVLGRGGMGEVYLAEDVRLGRKVALKFLPETYTSDEDRMRRFEREARAASALNHPNILTIYEVGSFENRQFIATEYVEGETLRQRQAHSPLKINEALDVAMQVASALSAAHQAGIVHRDIKPENIMLRHDGYAKVVDFGLAKLTETADSSPDSSTLLQVDTATGVVMGTTAYMSPEQARGISLDQRTDIWSLGVVLYELLSGRAPFKGETPSDLIVSILERDPTPLVPTQLIPSELDWIVRRALRKDREERYQTARELQGDLRNLKQQLDFAAQTQRTDPSVAGPISATEGRVVGESRSQETAFPTAQVGAAVTTEHKTRRSNRLLMIGLGAVLLAALGIVIYKFLPSKSKPPFENISFTRITNSNQAIDTTISQDGKYIVYALSTAGKQSLWIRQVSTANDKEIFAPAPVGIFGIAFSPDGNDLYYVIKANLDRGTLYRIPVLGGTPTKILEAIDGPVSFSPDGKQLVLIRAGFPAAGQSSLVIANIDGSNERTLATKQSPEMVSPIFFGGPSWSPDGTLIATSVAKVGGTSRVALFSVADGKEVDFPAEPWPFAARVLWTPDMRNLLVIAGENPGTSQLWSLSYPDARKRQITNELSSYRAIGISADGKKVSTIQVSGLVNIWIAPEGDAKRAVQLPTGDVGFFGSAGSSVNWTPDGRLVYVSSESNKHDIWIMNADGTNRRQLTSNAGMNVSPVVSHDGRFIVFMSNRAGPRNIWRMDIDGNNLKRLTSGVDDATPSLTPDDRFFFYSSSSQGKHTLWRLSTDGGTPVEIVNTKAIFPSVSPDGKFVLYQYPESGDSYVPPNRIAIISVEGGAPLKTFSFRTSGTIATTIRWAHDGRSIMYQVNDNNVTNLWSQSIDGGEPKQITDFKDRMMTAFAWSADGKWLAATRGNLLRDAIVITEN